MQVGDRIDTVNGHVPRDVIQWQLLTDEAEVELEVVRGGLDAHRSRSTKRAGAPLGIEVHSALFDQVRTCDNHCEFCFIYQLPPGLRRSLYVKDDDYRLSFLYGNYTTLTRFTEADLERVVTERLSPLNVSIHTTDPELRAAHAAQPTWRDEPALAARAARRRHHGARTGRRVPRSERRRRARSHARGRARPLSRARLAVHRAARREPMVDRDVVALAHRAGSGALSSTSSKTGKQVFLRVLGRRVAFLADEYYLLADRAFPGAEAYEGFPMHEDGIGMARTFELEMHGLVDEPTGVAPGFFAWVDGAPAEGYRAPRVVPAGGVVTLLPRRDAADRDPHR